METLLAIPGLAQLMPYLALLSVWQLTAGQVVNALSAHVRKTDTMDDDHWLGKALAFLVDHKGRRVLSYLIFDTALNIDIAKLRKEFSAE